MLAHLLLVATLQTCADAADCRRQAVDAIARGEYETAHDLAWRAMQKAKRNDPDVMFVLARTMALSGRPGDALVMLDRLADLGPVPDISSDPDFGTVRRLKGWPDLEAKLAGKPRPAPPPPVAPPAATAAPAASAPPTLSTPAAKPLDDGVSFTAPRIDPFALAHDAISRRFVLGDRRAHRLLVVDEVSHNVTTYVSAETAGFYDELTAFTIDVRRGDLWVASARGAGSERASIVHKLQLVSGRSLIEVRPPDRAAAVHIVALTVVADGTVYALDAAGPRLFRVRPGSRTLEEVMRLTASAPAAIAAAGDRTLYISGEGQLSRVDPAARTETSVKSTKPSGQFESLAWHDGTLIGIQHVGDGFEIVRLKLDSAGGRIVARDTIASSSEPTVGSLGGDSYYYLADGGTIRRLPLRR